MELDIFIPSLSLAIEYQGMQHYRASYRGDFQRQLKRDEEKQQQCKENGITLIIIPYWWDNKSNSLLATIQHYRPDLIELQNNSNVKIGSMIPSLPPMINKQQNNIHSFIPVVSGSNIDPVGKYVFETHK
jgi:allophanate hydrolase subunit 1